MNVPVGVESSVFVIALTTIRSRPPGAGTLWVLHTESAQPAVEVQTVVVCASMAASPVLRYLGMRMWIFTNE